MRPHGSLYRRLVRDRKGATAVEYGFIVALIVITIIASIQGLAAVTTGMWNNILSDIEQAS